MSPRQNIPRWSRKKGARDNLVHLVESVRMVHLVHLVEKENCSPSPFFFCKADWLTNNTFGVEWPAVSLRDWYIIIIIKGRW